MTQLVPAKPRDITAIAYGPTRYEVAIDDVPVAYISRKTKSALFSIARKNGEYILSKMENQDAEYTYAKATGFFFESINIKFTGRTERDAVLSDPDYVPPTDSEWQEKVSSKQPATRRVSEFAFLATRNNRTS